MIRRFGDPPEAGRRYVLRRGVYALLPLGGDLLLTVQSQPHRDLQLPGGGIDPGESPVAALHREVVEETGWRIANPRRIGAFRRYAYMPEYDLWAEKLCLIYIARPVRRLGAPTEAFHHATVMSATLAARELGNAGDRHFAARFAHAQTPAYSRRIADTSSSSP
ncbi:MAG: NUDIX domain-containing protein [Jhaorihella sp.]